MKEETLEELLELLPVGTLIPMEMPHKHFSFRKWWRKSSLHIWRLNDGFWSIRYENPNTGVKHTGATGKTLKEATQKMVSLLRDEALIS